VILYEKYKIRSLRLTLLEVASRATRSDGTLFIDGNREVSLVYYRTGYQFEQYLNESAWDARTLMECSLAIKCPSIDVHLTTFKKFQQAFSDESLLLKVMGESTEVDQIKHLFKGIWTLEYIESNPEVQEVVSKAINNPEKYVIKP